MKICDLTQFYSPVSGGVKRYVHEKIRYIQATPNDEHVLIIPGAENDLIEAERSRIYTIASPLISRRAQYRMLFDLRAIGDILERERPDLVESGDPYQVGWKALRVGHALNIPVVAFYHSHFPEAYLRGSERFLGRRGGAAVMQLAQAYVRKLYSQFEATLVPSDRLGQVLASWGVANIRAVDLGVDERVFQPRPNDAPETRASLGIPPDRCLLLYVGRLAPEKNTQTLFGAFAELIRRTPQRFHLLVVGDGQERALVEELQRETGQVTWRPYCGEAAELAKFYRAADLLVHPGVQETFGLTSLESQACGTPVIGIRGSYMDRIIFSEQSAWARENSAAALAFAIEEASRQDLRRLGEAASAKARADFTWRRVFDRLFCIYREVCADYGTS